MSDTELANYDAARWFLAEARRVDEWTFATRAVAMACYARRVRRAAITSARNIPMLLRALEFG
jgi:hypothetical protein